MNKVNRITIRAPLHKIFLAASDLTRWPEFLSHYRYNRFLSQTPSGGVVKMSCLHAGIPLTWISQFRIDPERRELHFLHLQAALNATRGMEVRWTFEEQPDGTVAVEITHDLELSWPFVGPFLANKVLGGFIIQRVAEKTLAGLKRKIEAQQQLVEKLAQPATPNRPRKKTAPPPKAKPRTAKDAVVKKAKTVKKKDRCFQKASLRRSARENSLSTARDHGARDEGDGHRVSAAGPAGHRGLGKSASRLFRAVR